MSRRPTNRSGALGALLLFLLLALGACGSASGDTNVGDNTSKDPATPGRQAAGTDAAPEAPAPEATTAPEAKASTGSAGARSTKMTALVHRAAPENMTNNSTYLDVPAINGDLDAVLLVTRESEEGDDHPIGVWYDRDGGRWAIFNQDLAPMAGGETFDVAVFKRSATSHRDGGAGETKADNQASETAFVHETTPENVAGDSTYVDDPLLDGDPDAALSLTQSWNPGGGDGVYNDHRVGVRYDAVRDRWAVFNRDRSAMPEGVAFNISVSNDGGEAGPSRGLPQFRDFFSGADSEMPANLISSDSSAGTIPVIKPFNFGRNPGGPEDKTLYLTIPRLGIEDVPVFDTVSEEKLRDGTVHIPATGYPWQDGANVFIAGHRIGYSNTPSYYVFYHLDDLGAGDVIHLEDSADRRYVYHVTRQTVVGPNSVEVMGAKEGESLVTLQTCTLPDYEERLIIQGELVEKDV